jgi:hypothetical protein
MDTGELWLQNIYFNITLFCSCHFLGECFLSLLFDLEFFFKHAAPLMVLLEFLLQSLVIAVIVEAVIRRPERKMDWSADMTSKCIAYADYLLQHCTSPSKIDRWVLECMALSRTDWLPAASDNDGLATTTQSFNNSTDQLELPSYAFYWQFQQQQGQKQPQNHQYVQQNKHQITHQNTDNQGIQRQNLQPQQHLEQERLFQHVKKRLKVLPPLRTTAPS